LKIDNREIGQHCRPYVIAELSANHNGSLDRAMTLIGEAKASGADAIKLQTYTADTLTIDSSKPDFIINGGLWDKRTLYDLYQEAHTPWHWHKDLFLEAKRTCITIFSSPFDPTAIDLLENLGAPAYKIASFEIVDLELIKIAASTGKPLIISTGLANLSEIEEAFSTAKEAGAKEIALLHCLSSYPAPPSEYKLNSIERLREIFGCEVGLSDHTVGNDIAIASVALGATIIEKHFTADTSGDGPDDSFSMDAAGLRALRESADTAWSALGFDDFKVQESERANLRFRRSLYFVRDVTEGQILTGEDIRSIRPGYGIPPKHLASLVGLPSPQNYSAGDRVTPEVLIALNLA
jgi:pseudaminic acid synthase